MTVLTKVLQKVVVAQLVNKLEFQLLPLQNFCFRPTYSTEIANCCPIVHVKHSFDGVMCHGDSVSQALILSIIPFFCLSCHYSNCLNKQLIGLVNKLVSQTLLSLGQLPCAES